jgi:fumarate hydratase subunit beta
LKHLKLPVENKNILKEYNVGEEILLDGVIYTARDKVHALINSGKGRRPFELKNNAVYYSGPTPGKSGFPLGSCGPTTSSRMDEYTPDLYRMGLSVTIGKGPRDQKVVESIKKHGGLYLVAYGGCGALYGSRIEQAEIIGFKELGPQAVYRIEVNDFPVLVGIDFFGHDIYKIK